MQLLTNVPDTVRYIASLLSVYDTLRLMQCDHKFYEILSSKYFWRGLIQQRLTDEPSDIPIKDMQCHIYHLEEIVKIRNSVRKRKRAIKSNQIRLIIKVFALFGYEKIIKDWCNVKSMQVELIRSLASGGHIRLLQSLFPAEVVTRNLMLILHIAIDYNNVELFDVFFLPQELEEKDMHELAYIAITSCKGQFAERIRPRTVLNYNTISQCMTNACLFKAMTPSKVLKVFNILKPFIETCEDPRDIYMRCFEYALETNMVHWQKILIERVLTQDEFDWAIENLNAFWGIGTHLLGYASQRLIYNRLVALLRQGWMSDEIRHLLRHTTSQTRQRLLHADIDYIFEIYMYIRTYDWPLDIIAPLF